MRRLNLNSSELGALTNLLGTRKFASLSNKDIRHALILAESPLREKYPINDPDSIFQNDEVAIIAMQIADEYPETTEIIQRYQDAFLDMDIRSSDINSSWNVKMLELIARTLSFVNVILKYNS